MKPTSSAPFAAVATICLLGATQTGCWDFASTAVSANSAQAGGSIVIAVVADHFVSGQDLDFEVAVTNLFDNSLLADPDYSAHADDFSIVPIYQAFVPSTASDYGIEVVAGVDCNITWKPNTTTLLDDAIAALQPGLNPDYIVVIGNDTGAFGCANSSWAYVTSGSFGVPILEHELGHLFGGLFDEYVSELHETESFPGVIGCRNCSTNTTAPHWMSRGLGGSFTNDLGCKLYGLGIVRPTSNCRMGNRGARFCAVCKREMDHAFAYFGNPDVTDPGVACPIPNPDVTNPSAPAPPRNLRIKGAGLFVQPPPPQPTPPAADQLVRVVVTLDRLKNAALVQRARNATGRFVPRFRRLGNYVYEVSEAGKTITVGVLSGDPFELHDFRGTPQGHPIQRTERADVVVIIPGQTIEALRTPGRAVQISFYRLATTLTAPLITPAVLADAKVKKQAEPIGTISADELKTVM